MRVYIRYAVCKASISLAMMGSAGRGGGGVVLRGGGKRRRFI